MKDSGKVTLNTSLSSLSNTCVVKARCVRNHCLATILAIPDSSSAMNPTWLPFGSITTYLFACSKPLIPLSRSSKKTSNASSELWWLTAANSQARAASGLPKPSYLVILQRGVSSSTHHLDLPEYELE